MPLTVGLIPLLLGNALNCVDHYYITNSREWGTKVVLSGPTSVSPIDCNEYDLFDKVCYYCHIAFRMAYSFFNYVVPEQHRMYL